MSAIKCVVIDDEQLARKLLKEYLVRIPELDLVGEFRNPLEAIRTINESNVDVIFLDIQMPNLTGLEFLKNNRTDAAVVFTTAYPEYAITGYELEVVDYLLKPFSFERFVRSVNKSIKVTSQKRKAHLKHGEKTFITVNSDHKTHKIILSEIDYIEGLKEYVSIYVGGKRIITLQALKNLEELLPSKKFMRVHKSYIISTQKVEVLEGNQLRIKDKLIPIGRSYKEHVVSKIFQDIET